MADVLNTDWAVQAFLISDKDLADVSDIQNRKWSSAAVKFTDARLGGNIPINPKYQYTRYADIRNKGRGPNRSDVSLAATIDNGQGRVYSEIHDDPMQVIYVCPGVPQFNSLTTFIRNAVDSDMVTLARTGRMPSITFKIFETLGTLFIARMFPVVAVTMAMGVLLKKFSNKPTSKFYTLKPTPHLYWSAVQNLVWDLSVNRGIVPKALNPLFDEKVDRPGKAFNVDQGYLDAYAELVPGIFTDNNVYDVFALASSAQRKAMQMIDAEYKKVDQYSPSEYGSYLKKELTGDGKHAIPGFNKDGSAKLMTMIDKFLRFSSGSYKNPDKDPGKMEIDARGGTVETKTDPLTGEEYSVPTEQSKGYLSSLAEEMDSQLRNGAMFAAFRVNHTGSVNESFSNSVVESAIGQQINGASSSMASTRFSLADGNIIGGMIGSAVGAVGEMAVDAAKGAASGLTLGMSNILDAVSGMAYIDVPKHWQSSSANLTRSSYTIELGGPYNNDLSLMSDKFIPLAMILALVLPRSTGKASYTSPFICSYYDRGRCQSRLAMVESVTVERGTGNQGFGLDGTLFGMKVTMTFVDLSTIMHMPIGAGTIFSHDSSIDEDGILVDYMAVLAGQDLYSQFYFAPRAKLKLAKMLVQKYKYTSPYWMGSMMHHTVTAGWINSMTFGLSGGVMEIIEAPLRGSATISGDRGRTG